MDGTSPRPTLQHDWCCLLEICNEVNNGRCFRLYQRKNKRCPRFCLVKLCWSKSERCKGLCRLKDWRRQIMGRIKSRRCKGLCRRKSRRLEKNGTVCEEKSCRRRWSSWIKMGLNQRVCKRKSWISYRLCRRQSKKSQIICRLKIRGHNGLCRWKSWQC